MLVSLLTPSIMNSFILKMQTAKSLEDKSLFWLDGASAHAHCAAYSIRFREKIRYFPLYCFQKKNAKNQNKQKLDKNKKNLKKILVLQKLQKSERKKKNSKLIL